MNTRYLGWTHHPKTAAGFVDATLEHMLDTQLRADRRDVLRSTLESEGRRACRDEQVIEPRQATHQVLRQPVGEVVLLRVGRQIDERQYRDAGRSISGRRPLRLCGGVRIVRRIIEIGGNRQNKHQSTGDGEAPTRRGRPRNSARHGRLRRGCRGFGNAHIGNELIAAAGNGDDHSFAENAAQGRDRLVEVVLLDDRLRPQRFDEPRWLIG
jgi:hypothetical protein